MRQVTKHAEKRLRKRLNIPKKSINENFGKAMLYGKKHAEFKGAFKRYLDYWGREYGSAPVVYGNTIYFVIGNRLITAWPVPAKFKDYIK